MMYTFSMDPARDIACETFVIRKSSLPKKLHENACKIPAVHFLKGRSTLSSVEADTLLAGIQKCKVMQYTPLVVSGFTCELGPDQFNQTLSLQRAKTVANLLQNQGFTIATVQGKGSQNPISFNRWELSKNRRVEIEPGH